MYALTDRNANAQTTSHAVGDDKQQNAAGVENNKMPENGQQTLGQKFAVNDNKSVSYVSPSDAILSPASQKLAGFKQKQINKQDGNRIPAARTLFARTPSSCSSGGFDDVNAGQGKA